MTIPTRNLSLQLVRVTEAAALAAARQMGLNDKISADRAAVDAMRIVLKTVEMDGTIVIGEGEEDEAPMLYNGERLGIGKPPVLDIAVDPIEGTRLVAMGESNAISVIALAPRSSMYNPGPILYMDKLAVGPMAKGVIDINAPVKDNLEKVARAKGKDMNDLTVVILNRPRHEELINEVRRCGARIRLIMDGDVAGALMTSWLASRIDVLMGIGGTPEAVLAACALTCMDGEFQGKLVPRNDDEARRAKEQGYDLTKVLTLDDLVTSKDVYFAATGITDGELLRGVTYTKDEAETESLVMDGLTRTVRRIITTHRLDQLSHLAELLK